MALVGLLLCAAPVSAYSLCCQWEPSFWCPAERFGAGPTIPVDVDPNGYVYAPPERVLADVTEAIRIWNTEGGTSLRLELRDVIVDDGAMARADCRIRVVARTSETGATGSVGACGRSTIFTKYDTNPYVQYSDLSTLRGAVVMMRHNNSAFAASSALIAGVLHEVGHALGLEHAETGVMHYAGNRGYVGPDAAAGMRALYGQPEGPYRVRVN